MSSGGINSRKSGTLPRILLTGRSGQVGGDLFPLLTEIGEVLATDRSSLDLTRPDEIRGCVQSFRPNIIINAAAYTAVDKAESEPELARTINTIAPGVFAEEAVSCGALLIHYSTDYVFNGRKAEPYVESDTVNPLNVYGHTKAAGEEAITRTGCAHLILRTSWVYSSRGANFLLTILRLAREREELRIVNDQVGAPTSSGSIANATLKVLEHCLPPVSFAESGIYHLTTSGSCSWYDFAREILRCAEDQGCRVKKLTPISTSEYPSPATRPMNSRLNCSKLWNTFGIKMPEWPTDLNSVLKHLLPQASLTR